MVKNMIFQFYMLKMMSLIREELSYTLERKVSKLFVAKDGEEGFELYKKKRTRFNLSDIRMPICDGIEMTKKSKNWFIPK